VSDDVKRLAGEIGERVVLEFFGAAVRANDWYDAKKDGTIHGMTYEVKTMRLNHSSQSFWIGSKQWPKCDGVDLLFFVKVPEKEDDGIVLYLSINHKAKKSIAYPSDGRICRKYPLTECIPLCTINDNRVQELLEHSKALSKHKRFA
jgi:hypothetical protein